MPENVAFIHHFEANFGLQAPHQSLICGESAKEDQCVSVFRNVCRRADASCNSVIG